MEGVEELVAVEPVELVQEWEIMLVGEDMTPLWHSQTFIASNSDLEERVLGINLEITIILKVEATVPTIAAVIMIKILMAILSHLKDAMVRNPARMEHQDQITAVEAIHLPITQIMRMIPGAIVADIILAVAHLDQAVADKLDQVAQAAQ